MIEYWYYTGDDRYNDMIVDGILFQTGQDNNFEPTNQTRTEVHSTPKYKIILVNENREMMIKHFGLSLL
jgi:hypothetical protein